MSEKNIIENMGNLENEVIIDTLEDLELILSEHNIPFYEWHKSEVGVKTTTDLFKEIKTGDCFFVKRGVELIRKVNVLAIRVFYTDRNGIKYLLRETKQVFTSSGKVRTRDKWSSVGEKLKRNEKPDAVSVSRALFEELQIDSFVNIYFKDSIDNQSMKAPSFPGVKSELLLYRFEVEISSEAYKIDGYTEEQDGLVTYFRWEKATDFSDED